MENILVTIRVTDAQKQLLQAASPDSTFIYRLTPDVTREEVQQADIIVGNVPPAFICQSPRLKLVQLFSAGTDGYTVPGVLAPHTSLTNATGSYGKAVGEHAVAMTLMLQKKLHLYHLDQTHCVWGEHGQVTSPTSSTVLVVGLGDIGEYYAKTMKALGAHVIGLKRRPGKVSAAIADEVYSTQEMRVSLQDALLQLLPQADIIFNILPGGEATAHIFNEAAFQAMKPGSIFINCGRGGAVDQTALQKALTEGPLMAAGIDVAAPEPLPADSPLWKLENLLITPHVSGNFHMAEITDNIVAIACYNIKALHEGTSLRNVVDFATGYKK